MTLSFLSWNPFHQANMFYNQEQDYRSVKLPELRQNKESGHGLIVFILLNIAFINLCPSLGNFIYICHK